MKKIIVVDDSMFMRATLKGILTKIGYDVIGEGADGEEAVRLYKEKRPDAISLDITMPKKDGIEALKEIRTLDKDAKVVMCSSMGQKYFVEDAIKGGASDFIVKPFAPQKVIETFDRICLKK